MHFVALALYAEGRSDYDFLGPVLLRLCEDLCVREASKPVEFPEQVLAVTEAAAHKSAPREERILAAARQAEGAWRILFVHADADGDADRARSERAEPGIRRLQEHFGTAGVGVAVVPVRETESWAIVDGDALRRASGSTASDRELGLPPARIVESTPEPKAVLDHAWRVATAARTRQRRSIAPMLSALGETIALERLRTLSAFQTLEQDLRAALQRLQVLG